MFFRAGVTQFFIMAFILGEKQEMTRIFKADQAVSATIIYVQPCSVVGLRTRGKDNYQAVCLAAGSRKKINKPLKGQIKGLNKNPRWLKEFKTDQANFKLGDLVKVDNFKPGQKVIVQGFSIGKGFQGVVKKYGFRGLKASHGTKHDARRTGSIGATGPGRVFKGRKMPSRMGGGKATIKNLEILKIDPDKNLLYLKGAVPGKRGTLLKIRSV